MQEIIGKTVTALYPGGQLLQDDYFEQVRERVFGLGRYRTKEDTGHDQNKKNVLSPTGVGANDRLHNPGAGSGLGREPPEQRAKGVGSGYNDGGPADDETGPGSTSQPYDPYATQTMLNDLFMDHYMRASTRDSIRHNVRNLLGSDPVVTPHRRYRVDN